MWRAPAAPAWMRCAVRRWRPDSRAANRPVLLGVDRQSVAWMDDSGQLATLAYHEQSDTAPDVARQTTIVMVANDLAVYWVQAPPAGVATLAELRLVAQARCAHLHGGVPADWWVGGDWQANTSFVCTALPMENVARVTALLAHTGQRPRWHTVWGSLTETMPGLFASEGWSCVRSPRRLLLWHCKAGQVQHLANLPLGMDDTVQSVHERAQQWIHAESARFDYGVQGPLHWLDVASDAEGAALPLPGITRVHLPTQTHQHTQRGAAPRDEAQCALQMAHRLQGVLT